MAKPCTAILVDPFARTIEEVTWNGDFHHIYDLIECDTFDCARIGRDGDSFYVDDDGLFKEEQAFFWNAGYPQPLAGKSLLMGTDENGESVSPKLSLEQVRSTTKFVVPVRINGGEVTWVSV